MKGRHLDTIQIFFVGNQLTLKKSAVTKLREGHAGECIAANFGRSLV